MEPKSRVNSHFVWRNKYGFSIKDSYKIYKAYLSESILEPLKVKALACLWKYKVSSKVQSPYFLLETNFLT